MKSVLAVSAQSLRHLTIVLREFAMPSRVGQVFVALTVAALAFG
jgi:hypothetical protein